MIKYLSKAFTVDQILSQCRRVLAIVYHYRLEPGDSRRARLFRAIQEIDMARENLERGLED